MAHLGDYVQISSGSQHTCGLENFGTVGCWGDDTHGQATPPTGSFIQVSAGGWHSCAIDGLAAIHCWGDDTYGQSTPP
jgi:alpha-tubulin suppressor-like RCC1 family protein